MVQTAIAGELRWVDVSLIDPNPWQPRTTIDGESIAKLANSIERNGLLQEPMGRLIDGGRIQLAFGHRRVEAARLLISDGRWPHGAAVPIKIVPDDDRSMAMAALVENTEREDISRLEELRAYSKALEEIPELTIQGLASSIDLDRTTLSKNLSILQLPDEVLAYVHDDRLSVRAARELLALRTSTHQHEDQMRMVLEACEGGQWTWSSSEVPNFTVKNVRGLIRDLVSGRISSTSDPDTSRLWRPLAAPEAWSMDTHSPSFDTGAFRQDHPGDVHAIPAGETSSKGEPWTCNVREWRRRQSATTRAANEAKRKDGAVAVEKKPGPSERWLDAVKRDPVVQSIIGSERTESIGKLDDLTEDEREKLGSRITRPDWKGSIPPGAVHGLPARVGPEWLDQVRAEEPPMFDFSECAGCTIGAGWAQIEYGADPQLVCFDDRAWQQKRAAGIEAFTRWRERTLRSESGADLQSAAQIAARMPAGFARAMVLAEGLWLRRHEAVRPYSSAYRKFDYYPATAVEFARMIGTALPPIHSASWSDSAAWTAAVRALIDSPPEEPEWRRAAGLLLVWKARVSHGLGGEIPTHDLEQTPHTADGSAPVAEVAIGGRPAFEVLRERFPKPSTAFRLLGFVTEYARVGPVLRAHMPRATYYAQLKRLRVNGIHPDQIGTANRGPGHGPDGGA